LKLFFLSTLQLTTIAGITQSIREPISNTFTFLSNPGALAHCIQMDIALYTEKRFQLRELNFSSAKVAIPVRSDAVGLIMSYGGYEEYNESQLAVAYGKNLGKIDIGAQFNYNMLRIAGFGSDVAMTAEIGTIWHLNDKTHFSLLIVNPGAGGFRKDHQETLASAYSVGIGYEYSPEFIFNAEIVKTEDKPVNIHIEMQYNLSAQFLARLGLSTDTSTPWFGAGWKWKNIQAVIISSYHPQLGISSGLELVFYGKDKKDDTIEIN